MPSNAIHQLGIELERINGYIKPQFPPDGHNSADYYDYGDNLLFGAALGSKRLRERLDEIPSTNRGAGSPWINVAIELDLAYEAMTTLQNDSRFNVHDRPREMGIVIHLLGALAASHALALNKTEFW